MQSITFQGHDHPAASVPAAKRARKRANTTAAGASSTPLALASASGAGAGEGGGGGGEGGSAVRRLSSEMTWSTKACGSGTPAAEATELRIISPMKPSRLEAATSSGT